MSGPGDLVPSDRRAGFAEEAVWRVLRRALLQQGVPVSQLAGAHSGVDNMERVEMKRGRHRDAALVDATWY
jgi:hypothetical protein